MIQRLGFAKSSCDFLLDQVNVCHDVNGLTNESIPEICKTETNQNKSFLNILPKPYILVSKKVNVLDKSYQIHCQYETTHFI